MFSSRNKNKSPKQKTHVDGRSGPKHTDTHKVIGITPLMTDSTVSQESAGGEFASLWKIREFSRFAEGLKNNISVLGEPHYNRGIDPLFQHEKKSDIQKVPTNTGTHGHLEIRNFLKLHTKSTLVN